MKFKRITAFFAALMMAALSCPGPYFAAENADIIINNTTDLESFAKKCKTDTWSHGKTVLLKADIDVSEAEFLPIATFDGTFDGGGHILSGININTKGSCKGLFRYIQEGALVKNLDVTGTVSPSGTREKVGGIVGELSGTIQNCSFNGEVNGEVNAGGIAGFVAESGVIEKCRFSGDVSAKNYAGGIAGQSMGEIRECSNNGSINTTDKTLGKKKNVTDISIDIESDISDIRNVENFDLSTDTGGICGYSKGKIIDCKNYGSVGCKSIGYNTGGICGRQCGYIVGCENYGSVLGRKDIGGIVGQAEPYILMEFTKDVLQNLQTELDAIKAIADGVLDSSDNDISDKIDDIGDAMTLTRDNVNIFSDDALDFADEIADRFNELSDRLQRAIDDSENVFDSLSEGADEMASGFDKIAQCKDYINIIADEIEKAASDAEKAGDDLSGAGESFQKATDKIGDAVDELEDAADSMRDGAEKLQDSVKNLSQALEKKNNIEKKFEDLWDCTREIANALGSAGTSIEDIKNALDEVLADKEVSKDVKTAIKNLGELGRCYSDMGTASQEICDALLLLAEDFDIYAVKNSLKFFGSGFSSLSTGFARLQKAIDGLDAVMDSVKTVSNTAKDVADCAGEGLEHIKNGTDNLKDAMDELKKIAEQLTEDGAIHMPSASEYMDESISAVKEAVKVVSDELEILNDIVRNKKNSAVEDMQRVSDRFGAIADILEDAYDNYLNNDAQDLYEDVSDRGIGGIWGRIESSKNCGIVNGDVNVGGIAGSMAIEYDFDPEDDIVDSGEKTLKFKYKTKCVVLRCENISSVTSKKDFCGGIAGKMDLGSVLSCENGGMIKSSDGNYVGGIAGKSDSSVKNSSSKCSVKGGDYIGGIVGEGADIIGCMACVKMSDNGEYAGSIAGNMEFENAIDNYFVGEKGGIDDINYSGRAESTDIASYVTFVENNFGHSVVFELQFVDGDTEIAKVPFTYGEALDKNLIPKVPLKEGYYGKWSDYDYDHPTYDARIEAEYYRNMDILPSEAKRENGKSVVIICGAFDDAAKVKVERQETDERDRYSVAIENVYAQGYTVRYLPLKKNSDIYILYGDESEKAVTEQFADYLEFDVKGNDFIIVEKKHVDYTLFIWTAVIILAACTMILRKMQKKKNKGEKAHKKIRLPHPKHKDLSAKA